MPGLTPQALWNLSEKEFKSLLNLGDLKPQSNTIHFYAPSFAYYKTKHFCSSTKDFPTISITGNSCALNCKHCGGKVLESMHSAISPKKLFELGLKLKENGATGVLVSGGCLPDGSVPLDGFLSILERFKRELGFTVFVHTGVIKPKTALALKGSGVDAALIDVIGSEETVKKAFNLRVNIQDYASSLVALKEARLNVVPHVIVGLNDGKLDGEYNALQIIQQYIKPSALVIIAFMPIQGTEMEKTTPPKAIDIAKVAATARLMFPQTPLVIGCMRPKGKSRAEIDTLSLKAGADAVAFPSEEAIEYAKNNGYKIVYSPFCCAQIFRDFLVNS
jgi:uncharacterized radical SAM superfamily protein